MSRPGAARCAGWWVWLMLACAPPATAAAPPGAPEIASYEIDARLDVSTHTVTGHEVLTWRNTTPDVVADLYFHLYLNAFANSRSSFMRAAAEQLDAWRAAAPNGWGGQDITRLLVDGDDRTAAISFVHPDDANVEDRTVIRVPLTRAVKPGATARVEIDFVSTLPRIFARAGYAGPFHFVAQWFPKIGVYENGRWICHQYHRFTEFFADFGSYDVRLTVPAEFVVGATGARVAEPRAERGTVTHHYRAANVHDFAWTADPRFVEVTDRFDDTRLRLLVQPEHVGQARRYLGAVAAAMASYRDWFGAYPYPELTIVDPGPGGFAAGGMEYPGLITVGTTWWMPARLRFPEVVAIHEFGHQYWYGMVASNEAEEAWLDEGVNTYVEGLIMDATYGQGTSYTDLFGIRVDSQARARFGYLRAPQFDPPTRPAWLFLDRASYAAASYSKVALALATLQRRVGAARMLAALRHYFETWRFRHPTGEDFVAALSASLGEDVGEFFEQVLHRTGVLDYAVGRVQTAPLPYSPAVLDADADDTDWLATAERTYRNEVVVERRGELRMPVEIVIGFQDGTETSEVWDGQDRWRRWESTGPQRVEYAFVDPHGKLPLDVNLLNNSRMRATGTRGIIRLASRWGFWVQNLLHVLTGL